MRKSVFILTSLLMTSCSYKELCYDHNHTGEVSIRYNWTNTPETALAGTTALFYSGEGEPVRYDFTGMQGGPARLSPGSWQVVSYNNDTEAILYRGNTVESLEAYTRPSSLEEGTKLMTKSSMPKARGTEQEPVILEPDLLWGGASEVFEVADGQSHVIPVPMGERAVEIEVTIHNVPNLEYTSGLGGALSGLAGSVFVADGKVGSECVTQSFEVAATGPATLQMRLNTFGHCPKAGEGPHNTHILTIYAVLADGSQWYYTTDVTVQMHDPVQNPNRYHINLSLDQIPLPKPIINGSGFQPTVDSWQGVEIEIGM